MEVHHHTHSGRKRFVHYLWEFVMLFLAVFCGFLAEYQLEHKIEKEKGKQYLKSFVEDLKTDTSNFSNVIKIYREKAAGLASYRECYASIISKKGSDQCIVYLFFASAFFPDLVYTDRTLQQMKNAGGLRMIPRQAADSITDYDRMLREYQKTENSFLQETQQAVRASIYSLNNFGVGDTLIEKHMQNHNQLFSDDRRALNTYFNQLYGYYSIMQANIEEMTNIKLKATRLIEFFQKKYL
jgi:hypothetical protein